MPRSFVEIDPLSAHELHYAGVVVLLDIRENHEWAAGHAPGADHVPLGHFSEDDHRDRRPILAICRSGARSAKATRLLIEADIDARNVTGGMRAWVADGLPIIATTGAPGSVA